MLRSVSLATFLVHRTIKDGGDVGALPCFFSGAMLTVGNEDD
jgi:hypothetical protein